ncbi:homogentisate 1,2-dioxygenase (plasmid) [Sphingomonas paeninsulae]|uniref:Homogentisate 1,2-dioxygenase n=1 Tax=Sphingomonas paeninsulae TaxID=2319844 RepID=A0A494T835_SPHPE|nr:homogentisate 1,2-dioxygenase [Sphingomonas paeninsulae]AYJ85499.1 homogentisate 1,2-dioxygenase [Sphingomonas paeninsulae]
MKTLTLAFVMLAAIPAVAQTVPMTPLCPADAQPIPTELASWPNKKPLIAATTSASLGAARAIPGVAVNLTLADTPAVTYPVRPAHPGGSVSHGGLIAFTIDRPGTYRVAIGSGAWLDLLKGSTSLESVGHGHGPNCSGIRKMVDFTLQPGDYVLQIAGNGTANLPLLITKLP